MHADEIVFLRGGEIFEPGTHGQLMSLREHYAALWHAWSITTDDLGAVASW